MKPAHWVQEVCIIQGVHTGSSWHAILVTQRVSIQFQRDNKTSLRLAQCLSSFSCCYNKITVG